MDRDGFISNGELFLVLKMMVGSNLKVGVLEGPSRSWLTFVYHCRTSSCSRLSTRRSWKPTKTGAFFYSSPCLF